MKKLFKSAMMLTVCAFTMCLFFTSCNNDDDDTPSASKTFNDLMKEDCDFVKSNYGSAEHITFLEVDAMFEDWFDETKAEDVKVSEMTTIFQVDQKVVSLVHDLQKGTRSVEEEDDLFIGCVEMSIEDFKVTLEEAVKIMKLSDEGSDVHTRYLTVRNPLGKIEYDHPMYIFGQYAGVDVYNGNVIDVTDPSFNDAMIDDYDWAKAKYGDDVLFYEVHTTLSGFIDELPLNQIHVVCDTAIFEKPNEKLIYVARNLENGLRRVSTSTGRWDGSVQFNPYDINITFKEAVKIFAESDIKHKHISVMRFRRILDPKYKHPMYIFGRVAGVDAVTGEVIPM